MLNARFVIVCSSVLLASAGASVEQRRLLLTPDAPEFTRPAPEACVVRLETNRGTVDIEITRARRARRDRFVNLVRTATTTTTGSSASRRAAGCSSASTAIRRRQGLAREAAAGRSFTQSNVCGTVAFAFAAERANDAGNSSICATTRHARQGAVHALRPRDRGLDP
jgi:hypothetical protein